MLTSSARLSPRTHRAAGTARARRAHPAPYAALPAALLLACAGLTACSDGDGDGGAVGGDVAELHGEVLAEHPWDASSFTQGLEVMPEGDLLVSTGLEGRSRAYRAPVDGGRATADVQLPDDWFGEGITRHDDTVWQLTWHNGIAAKRDATTLAQTGEARYDGEGWGLCSNGERLVMSDGSDRLTFRDPSTFAETGHVDVTLDGKPVDQLNELDCSGGVVWANLWQSDRIVRINTATGAVTGVLDIDLPAGDRPGADVLNGIAAVPGTTDRFYLTGKLWDTLYEVRISG
jgi:glutamine cyclotransferase